MKKLMFVFGLLAVSTAEAQTPNFHITVTNLWFQGYKSNVLEMAEQRLNINSNDMPGLLILNAYEMEFSQFDAVSNTLNRITLVGETITNENFKPYYPFLKFRNDYMLEYFSNYPPSPATRVEEQAKGLIPYKPFMFNKELEALQKDGLCEPLGP